MSIKQRITDFRYALPDDAEHLLSSAKVGASQENGDWLAICEKFGIDVVDENATPQTGGALPEGAVRPLHVRKVLQAFYVRNVEKNQRYYAEVEALGDTGLAIDLEAKLDANKRFLHDLIEGYTQKYVVSLKPKLTVSGIFGNAMLSTKGFEKTAAGATTKKCGTCGAPRPAGTNLKICDYCGGDFK